MKLNGFQSKNVEEDKIVPQLKEAAKRFNIDIAPETPLERIKVSPNRKSYFFGAGHTYCCCGYESSDRKSYLVFDMGSGNACCIEKSAAAIKPLEDKICLNNTQLELKITEKGPVVIKATWSLFICFPITAANVSKPIAPQNRLFSPIMQPGHRPFHNHC